MPRRKVYLPKWYRWFIIPFVFVMWGFLTHQAFVVGGEEGPELVIWLVTTVVLAVIAVVIWG